jgi:hypothetical protein
LEDAECLKVQVGLHPFTHDGRLLALCGWKYAVKKEKVGKNDTESVLIFPQQQFLRIWDTQTGKIVKSWNKNTLNAFNPARPVLALFESNGDDTRLGLWDFSAEIAEKK